MKILVIGSMGFIGSHIYNFLSEKNEVWGADVIDDKVQKNYFSLEKNDTRFEQIFKAHQFELCINASGNGSVSVSLNQPQHDFELNVLNTLKILDSIRVYNPLCKFINMSSAAVYGNPSCIPIKESSSLKPLSPYGWHKLYAEQICMEYFYLYNIRTINLRLFSVYGEGLTKQLFWDIYQKTKRSQSIELFGLGSESRDFIYILDLLKAIECIVRKGLFNGEAVNVASGLETTIKVAAVEFCSYIHKDINVNFNMLSKPGDPLNWCADISYLKQWGFEPSFTLSKGLENTALWMMKN